MKPMSVAYSAAGAVLVFFGLLAMLVPRSLGITARMTTVLTISLYVLGIAASALLFLILRARAKQQPEPAASDDEVDAALRAARARLARSPAAGKAKLGKRPLILLLGAPSSGKTTTVIRSGLDPELLAGEVHRGENVVPSGVNVWFASDIVLVEAGGKIVAEGPRWARLLRHLKPSRLGAAFSRGTQAPRLAVVCFSCDELLKPGAGESVPAAAQRLRARITEMATRLGIRLPVYVIFTKADRLPYFQDFVRSIPRDEAAEVLGATLPIPPLVDSGHYAESESGRLNAAFADLLTSLSLKRLDVLPRETAEEVRAGAYEFPRELRKVSALAVQFMMDLCRPSQLGTSPFLRGFYFTGVRPVVVADSGPAAAPMAAASAMDATSVFDPRAMMGAQQPGAAPGSRRIPDWTFLPRVFKEIILRDKVAMAVTGGGVRVSQLRRFALGALTAVFAFLCLGTIASWHNNHRLIGRGAHAAGAVRSVNVSNPLEPAVEDLDSLDVLRSFIAGLRADSSPSMWRRFWLYRGNQARDTLRRLYFNRLDGMAWRQTYGRLELGLASLDQTYGYEPAYNALKAYKIVTSYPHESTTSFLTPVLMTYWQGGRAPNPVIADRAKKQFDFYAAELPHGDPYRPQANDALIGRTCQLLAGFAGTDRYYQALLSQADGKAAAVQLPSSSTHLQTTGTVRGAFTPDGWKFVHTSLQNPDTLLAHESWVCEQTVQRVDRSRLAGELLGRYRADYVQNWRGAIANARVPGYSTPQGGQDRLRNLSGGSSPLLGLFLAVSRNTVVDSTIRLAFQPVHAFAPPDPATPAQSGGYMAGLQKLESDLGQLKDAAPPDRPGLVDATRGTVNGVRDQVNQIAATTVGPAAETSAAVRVLLLAPLNSMDAVLRGLAQSDLAGAGRSFCASMRDVLNKYPFNENGPDADPDADVITAFHPASGAVITFANSLTGTVQRFGNVFRAAPGARTQPGPNFLNALNGLFSVSRAMFSDDGSGPQVTFHLLPVPTPDAPQINVNIDAVVQRATQTSRNWQPFTWSAARAQSARITGTVAGKEVEISETGVWSLFRVLQRAAWSGPDATGVYLLQWRFPETTSVLKIQLRFEGPFPIFSRAYLRNIRCVPSITS